MVSGSTMDGGPLIVSAKVRNTILSIKEIVGDHSDADIYLALKETNMDPNETAQKLLNQDPFREVKRRRDRKKEPQRAGHKGLADPPRHSENVGQGKKLQAPSDHNVRRKNNSQNTLPGMGRGFRAVRDNRVNRMTYKEVKPPLSHHTSSNEQQILNSSENGSSAVSGNQKPYGGTSSSQASNDPPYLRARHSEAASNGMNRISAGKDKQSVTLSVTRRVQPNKSNNDHQNSATVATSSIVGVYSSLTDPVHVPSPDSRSPGAVGAVRRDVGAVGVRRRSSENSVKHSSNPNSVKHSSNPSNSIANAPKRKDGTSTTPIQSYGAISKSEQFSQANATKTSFNGMPGGRPSSRHQQTEGHQRVSQPNKEWKPKSSQKLRSNPGVIGTPKKPDENVKEVKSDTEKLQDKLSQLSIFDQQNVIIAQHIRVPETDRCQLTFGTIGAELDSSRHQPICQSSGTTEKSNKESPSSLSVPALESSDDVSGGKQVDLREDHIRTSESESPASGTASEQQLPDYKETLSPQNLENYADIRLAQVNSSESQQQQNSRDIPGFSAYDAPTGYDIPYFRPTMDETVRSQSQPSSQEGLNTHASSSITASTIPMVQQPAPVAQMYPQVHVSHFANVMPFRQFLSPVYVPPMAVPGYSSNPPYPHPSNGNSYLLMPGGGSHLNANSLKYGLQQFKHVPSGSPTGFGNFASSAGYAMNAPGVIGGATALEDSSRIKYKDNSLYVPNPQAETSEIWIQNPRELPGMQSTPTYYNMPGQAAHAPYIPSHAGHPSFNAVAAQSSNMQYPPGMYHAPPQPAAIASPHHLGPAMANNLGVGVAAAAPGAQVGAYQQSQLGHLNWAANF